MKAYCADPRHFPFGTQCVLSIHGENTPIPLTHPACSAASPRKIAILYLPYTFVQAYQTYIYKFAYSQALY